MARDLTVHQATVPDINDKFGVLSELTQNLSNNGTLPISAVVNLTETIEELEVPSGTPTSTTPTIHPGNNTLLSANGSRKLGTEVWNRTNVPLYVKYGSTATASSYTEVVPEGERLIMDTIVYTGRVDAYIPSAFNGDIQVTEYT